MSSVGNVSLSGAKWVLSILFLVAAASQARVHLWGRHAILERAKDTKRFVVSKTEFARRGTIFSADGRVLAQSDDGFELGIDYSRCPESPGFDLELAEAAQIPSAELSEPRAAGHKSRTWKRVLSLAQAKAVQDVKSKWRADGVSLRRVLRRDYPMGEVTAAIVGNVREEAVLGGLEKGLDAILTGKDGYMEGMVDRTGSFLPMRLTDQPVAKRDGQSITLTIDSRIQSVAMSQIKHAVESNQADRGMVVALDPMTGDIQAMACWPTFDPAGRRLTSRDTDFNPLVMGAFEPGSTFKILTLAKALDKGVVSTDFKDYCTGSYQINKHWRIRCDLHNGTRAHGQVDLEKAIAKSCNVCAARWALKVGYADMVNFLEQLGLLERTQVGLPGERGGMFDRKEYAKALQIANVGFGQSVTATPLALTSAFASIANGGIRAEPRLVKRVGRKDIAVKEGKRVLSPIAAAEVARVMESVIETDMGTGSKLRITGYRLAGKTGTAQKVNAKTGKIGGGGYVSSFVGFVPANQPRSVVLVMVDNPKGGKYYGSSVAGPVFTEMARSIVRVLDIPTTVAAP